MNSKKKLDFSSICAWTFMQQKIEQNPCEKTFLTTYNTYIYMKNWKSLTLIIHVRGRPCRYNIFRSVYTPIPVYTSIYQSIPVYTSRLVVDNKVLIP